MVSADTPHLAEAPVSGPIDGTVPAELVDLAALPVIAGEAEKTLEKQGISADSPLKTSGYNASDRGSFPWLALWMTGSFSLENGGTRAIPPGRQWWSKRGEG